MFAEPDAGARSEPAADLSSLPTELVVAIAATLPKAQNLLALSSTSWTLRRAIVSTDSAVAWDALAARAYGAQCIELTRRAHWWQAPPSGFALYRGCAAFLRAVEASVVAVDGSVVDQCGGCEVVACPCLPGLEDFGFGAQGAIRDAAGDGLERELRALRRDAPGGLPLLSTTVVGGGDLCPLVAMVCTVADDAIYTDFAQSEEAMRAVSARQAMLRVQEIIAERLHKNLFKAVRARGARSIAMPTLGTGGQGLHPESVAAGLGRALANDALAHPGELLRVRICCFDRSHAPIFRENGIAPFLETVFLGQPAAELFSPLTPPPPPINTRDELQKALMGLWLADGPVAREHARTALAAGRES